MEYPDGWKRRDRKNKHMSAGATLSWAAVGAMIALSGAAFTAGALVQKFRNTKDQLVEGHRYIHADLERFAKEINGHNHITRETCPVCDGDD